jgi:hypothetical protein
MIAAEKEKEKREEQPKLKQRIFRHKIKKWTKARFTARLLLFFFLFFPITHSLFYYIIYQYFCIPVIVRGEFAYMYLKPLSASTFSYNILLTHVTVGSAAIAVVTTASFAVAIGSPDRIAGGDGKFGEDGEGRGAEGDAARAAGRGEELRRGNRILPARDGESTRQ